jgi:hypothetical protein
VVDEALIISAAALARHSPDLWGRFVSGLEKRSVRLSQSLLNAPADKLQHGQGAALEAYSLYVALNNCMNTASSIDASRK